MPGSGASLLNKRNALPITAKNERVHPLEKPRVTIEMENGDVIVAELDPEVAPNTVKNFVSLAQGGFYDDLIFHRVIPGFMIQGGCPLGTGTGGPGHHIRGEFALNGHDNPLRHSRGVLSMARAGHPDSAGSQFFIMVANSPHLDGQYAAFGTVIEGMDAVDTIVGASRDARDKPHEDQKIRKITVDLGDIELGEPEVI